MPLNQTQFQLSLKSAILSSATKAFKSTFELEPNENETIESIKTKISNEFAKNLADGLSSDLSTIITQYILSCTPVPTLVAGPYPVVGTIQIT